LSLADRLRAEKASSPKRATAGGLEIERICRLPVVPRLTDVEVEAMSRLEVLGEAYRDGFRLKREQAHALVEYDRMAGLFAPIGVGRGKTLVTLMIAQRAFEKGIATSILMVPPEVYQQLTETDIPWARARVRLTVPFHMMHGRSAGSRKLLANSGKRGCYIMPHSFLSVKDTHTILTSINAGCIIVDEVHKIKNRESARTQRALRYIDDRDEQPELVALSGTITKRSLRDYHHLLIRTLGTGAPIPLGQNRADEWAAVLDAKAAPGEAQTGPVRPLLDWARRTFSEEKISERVDGFRQAYRLRLNSAPGVVVSGDAHLDCGLLIRNTAVANPEKSNGWEDAQALIKQVEDLWISPSGDEIDHAIHLWRYLFELNSWGYHRQKWPDEELLRERKGWSTAEAQHMLGMAKDHHAAQQLYHKGLREWLKRCSMPGCDTPMLVGQNMSQHPEEWANSSLFAAWKQMRSLEMPGMPERDSIPVRVCDYKVRHAADWAEAAYREDGGGIIWCYHREMGAWVYEMIQQLHDIPVIYCPSGRQHNMRILDHKNRNKIIVASLTAHGTGKNLQHHQRCLFTQFPRQADDAEQGIGRLHREGQDADEVPVDLCNTTEFDHMNFCACLVDALYLQQTVGAQQKLIYANYQTLPRIYPSGFLRERGFENEVLDERAEHALAERFGVQPQR